jgi:hypothetical protein
MPFIYKLGNKALAWLFRLLFGADITDPLTGMCAARTDVLREAALEARNFDIEVDILAKASGARVAEVPIQYRRRICKKKLMPWHGISIASRMISLAYRLNPTLPLTLAGALLTALGAALAGWVAYRFSAGRSYKVGGVYRWLSTPKFLASSGLRFLNKTATVIPVSHHVARGISKDATTSALSRQMRHLIRLHPTQHLNDRSQISNIGVNKLHLFNYTQRMQGGMPSSILLGQARCLGTLHLGEYRQIESVSAGVSISGRRGFRLLSG